MEILQNLEVEQYPSLTFKIDLKKGRLSGTIDDLDAIKQAVFVIMNTERFRYLIHSDGFGVELDSLIGTSPMFVQSELRRRVTEALLQDDRITNVEDFQFKFNEESVLVSFTVVTEYGEYRETTEVSRNV